MAGNNLAHSNEVLPIKPGDPTQSTQWPIQDKADVVPDQKRVRTPGNLWIFSQKENEHENKIMTPKEGASVNAICPHFTSDISLKTHTYANCVNLLRNMKN